MAIRSELTTVLCACFMHLNLHVLAVFRMLVRSGTDCRQAHVLNTGELGNIIKSRPTIEREKVQNEMIAHYSLLAKSRRDSSVFKSELLHGNFTKNTNLYLSLRFRGQFWMGITCFKQLLRHTGYWFEHISRLRAIRTNQINAWSKKRDKNSHGHYQLQYAGSCQVA